MLVIAKIRQPINNSHRQSVYRLDEFHMYIHGWLDVLMEIEPCGIYFWQTTNIYFA